MSLTPFHGEYRYYSDRSMLVYDQPMTLDTVGAGERICCGRLYGVVKAYKYKGNKRVTLQLIDDDDMDYCCSVKVNDEDTQRRLFCETVNVLRDYRFYKIDWVWGFWSDFLLNSVDKILIEQGEFI